MRIELGVSGKKRIAQAIGVLLTTPKGAVPFRPEFGLGAENLSGSPADALSIQSAVAEQLDAYEPRIDTKRIQVLTPATGEAVVRILYTIRDTGEEAATLINF